MLPLANRVLDMPRSGIREIMDLAGERDDVVHLEVGQPDFRTPDHIVEAAVRAARDGYHAYTPNKGFAELREAAADALATHNRIRVQPDGVVVTMGAVNGLFEVLAAVLEPGDGLLLPDPGWPNYAMMATLLHAQAAHYPVSVETDGEPDLDRLEALIASTERAKVLLLNTPNNPTGAVYRQETIERVLELCQRYDLLLLSDECYDRIVFEGTHISPAAVDPSRVVTITSVSKTYAMTGWRVGFVASTDASFADMVAKVQEPVVSCASAVAQKAAEAALCGDQEPVARMVAAYRRRRDVAVDLLTQHGLALAPPRGAFYAMADISQATDDSYAFARRAVSEFGVAVAPGETFGAAGRGTVRLSLATDEPLIAEGISRLATAVTRWNEAAS